MSLLRRRAMMIFTQENTENIIYFRSGDVGWRNGTVTSLPEPFEGRYTSDAILIFGDYTGEVVHITAISQNGNVINDTPRWNAYTADGMVVTNVDYTANPVFAYQSQGFKWIRYRQLKEELMVDRIVFSKENGDILKTYKTKYID